MRYLLAFSLIFLSFSVFGQKKSEIIFPPEGLSMKYPEYIDACEVLEHKKELVYTRFIYSGMEEYWSLKSEKGCDEIDAYLDIPNDVVISSKFAKQLKDVRKNYPIKYLLMDVIGIFENDNRGYGHLGSNNSKFTVKRIVNIQSVKKKIKGTG